MQSQLWSKQTGPAVIPVMGVRMAKNAVGAGFVH